MAPRKGARALRPAVLRPAQQPEHRVTRCEGVRLSDRVLRLSRTLVSARPGRGRCWHGGQGAPTTQPPGHTATVTSAPTAPATGSAAPGRALARPGAATFRPFL